MTGHNPHTLHVTGSLAASSGATAAWGVWTPLCAIADSGLTWSLVPQLLFGLAALITAILAAVRFAMERRHERELHAARVAVILNPRVGMPERGA